VVKAHYILSSAKYNSALSYAYRASTAAAQAVAVAQAAEKETGTQKDAAGTDTVDKTESAETVTDATAAATTNTTTVEGPAASPSRDSSASAVGASLPGGSLGTSAVQPARAVEPPPPSNAPMSARAVYTTPSTASTSATGAGASPTASRSIAQPSSSLGVFPTRAPRTTGYYASKDEAIRDFNMFLPVLVSQ
jgi:hypothetical protein